MKATDELLKQIKELNIEEFKKEESFDCVSIGEYLCSLLTSHDLQPKDIILNLNMERSYTYQILNGRRKPYTQFSFAYCNLYRLVPGRNPEDAYHRPASAALSTEPL